MSWGEEISDGAIDICQKITHWNGFVKMCLNDHSASCVDEQLYLFIIIIYFFFQEAARGNNTLHGQTRSSLLPLFVCVSPGHDVQCYSCKCKSVCVGVHLCVSVWAVILPYNGSGFCRVNTLSYDPCLVAWAGPLENPLGLSGI